jgi:hypothetical protein
MVCFKQRQFDGQLYGQCGWRQTYNMLHSLQHPALLRHLTVLHKHCLYLNPSGDRATSHFRARKCTTYNNIAAE